MEKRVLAAIALSIAILLLFRYYEERRLGGAVKQRPPAAKQVPSQPPPAAVPAVEPKAEPAVEAPIPAAGEVIPERKVVVEGELYRAVLDNRGAVLTVWELKQYKSARGEVFDMIPTAHMEERPFPTSLLFDDPSLTSIANGQTYSVEVLDGKDAATITPPATVVMRLRRGDLSIEKRFQFDAKNYLVDFAAAIQRGGTPVRARMLLGQDIGPEHEHLINQSLKLMAAYNLGGKVVREAAPEDENEVRQISGTVTWVGLDMQYFSQIAIPAHPFPSFEMQRRPVQAAVLGGEEVKRDLIRVLVPADGSAACRIYFGPKVQSFVEAVPGADLRGVIDYGTYLGVLVRPLLAGLRFINQFTNNYGFAIILLTAVLTLALFPFRLKQMASMKKMQVLQPRIKEIQEKYRKYKKTDPKRAEMNQEVMALYKQHNVNPLGGCLPLILQMPLLFAFYRLLANSIELRQAPFVGWIHDLSAMDPYYVLPIVMGITMVISQKMTPMTPGTDPTQAKMMMLMPVVFTFMFLWVSAGLNLYFLCSNVFQIAFQKIAERWMGDQRPGRKSTG